MYCFLQCFDALGLGGRKGIRPVKTLNRCGSGGNVMYCMAKSKKVRYSHGIKQAT